MIVAPITWETPPIKINIPPTSSPTPASLTSIFACSKGISFFRMSLIIFANQLAESSTLLDSLEKPDSKKTTGEERVSEWNYSTLKIIARCTHQQSTTSRGISTSASMRVRSATHRRFEWVAVSLLHTGVCEMCCSVGGGGHGEPGRGFVEVQIRDVTQRFQSSNLPWWHSCRELLLLSSISKAKNEVPCSCTGVR